MSSVELEMRGVMIISDADLDRASCDIRRRCDRSDSRVVVYFLVSLFSGLVKVSGFREMTSVSDAMGSLSVKLHIISGDYFLKLDYEQSITSTWHHVEIDSFLQENILPAGILLRYNLDLTTDGWMAVKLYGIDESTAEYVTGLARKCFKKVRPTGTPEPDVTGFLKNM